MQDSELPPRWGEMRRVILGSRVEKDERCEGIGKSSKKLLLVTKFDRDNQSGEEIQVRETRVFLEGRKRTSRCGPPCL